MVSETLIHGEGYMHVSDSMVVAPAVCLGILNFLFSSKRVSHRGTDEVYVFAGLYPLFF